MRFSKSVLATVALLGVSYASAETINVDALVLYSTGVERKYNGDEQTRIDHLIATTNKIYQDSGLDIQLNPVKVMHYDLDDEKESLDVLKDVQSDEAVKDIMDEVGADEVIIYRPYVNDGVCGVAYQNNVLGDPDRAEYAKDYTYAHVSIDCSDYVTAHEVGHNMGLGHSAKQESVGAYTYARGHGVENNFVTVMAYQSAYNGEKIYKFSSPKLECNGLPCGVPEGEENEADAVKALIKTVPILASFREHKDVDSDTIKELEEIYLTEKAKLEEVKKILSQKAATYITQKENFYSKYNEFQSLISEYNEGKIPYSVVSNYNYQVLQPAYTLYRDAIMDFVAYYYDSYKPQLEKYLEAYQAYIDAIK